MVQTAQAAPCARQTYTVSEMAVLYGIKRTLAYELARKDQFPVPRIKLGSRIVYRRTDVWADLHLTADPLAEEVPDGSD